MLPIIIHTKKFPPQDFRAITLFPFILYKGAPLTTRDQRHETVHLWQQMALLVVPFYLLYFIFWLVNLARYRDYHRAYHEILFEQSAYRLEKLEHPSKCTMAFDWLKHITLCKTSQR